MEAGLVLDIPFAVRAVYIFTTPAELCRYDVFALCIYDIW
jgi:hypothetical protein